MCDSKAQGGRRCAGDARGSISRQKAALADAIAEHAINGGDDREVRRARAALGQAQFWYDTTPEGQATLEQAVADQEKRLEGLAVDDRDAEANALKSLKGRLAIVGEVRESQQTAFDRFKAVQRGEVGVETSDAIAIEPHKTPVFDPQRETYQTQVGVIAIDETHHDGPFRGARRGTYPVYVDTRTGAHNLYTVTGAREDTFRVPYAYTPGMPVGPGNLVLRDGAKHDTRVLAGSRTDGKGHVAVAVPSIQVMKKDVVTHDLTDPDELEHERTHEPDPWGLPGSVRRVGQDTAPDGPIAERQYQTAAAAGLSADGYSRTRTRRADSN